MKQVFDNSAFWFLFGLIFLFFCNAIFGQNAVEKKTPVFQNTDSTVTDYDGNLYHTVTIGDRVWLKENIKSVHYADGTPIPNVTAYNNSDSLAEIYGRLYTWYAAVRDSSSGMVRGVCPCEWHVPTSAEWETLENYLGGAAVAGGKMKTTGTTHWQSPNTGATNSSGFSALPAGEWDPNSPPSYYRLIYEYAVFWTATSVSNSKARERYLAYNKNSSSTFDWYKTLKYSIRCVRNQPATGLKQSRFNNPVSDIFTLGQNYPNPFNPVTHITYSLYRPEFVTLDIYNVLGKKIQMLVSEYQYSGEYAIPFFAYHLPAGSYFYRLEAGGMEKVGEMFLIK